MAARAKALSASRRIKRGRKSPPQNENRHDRFTRVGTRRMQNTIHQIRLLGNLCRPIYQCDTKDLTLVRNTIINELDMALARFAPRVSEAKKTPTFSFNHNIKSAEK